MSVAVGVLVLSTVLGVLAIVVLASGDRPRPDRRGATGQAVLDRALIGRLVGALGTGLLVVASSGWLLPGVVVAAMTFHGIGAWQRRDRRAVGDLERTDALASWIENLRDVLIAGDQPIGAITATVATCPSAIRPQVRRLAASLGRREPEVVLRRFADEVDDPLGDLVAAGLLIAIGRGARTVAVLTALAQQARLQADRRRLVDAERAPVQREVQLLSIVMGALVVALMVLGRADYLEPYGSPGGQVFLAVVLTIYGALLLRVQRLARAPRPARFLTLGTDPHDHRPSDDRLPDHRRPGRSSVDRQPTGAQR
jgi:cobalamin synthase